MELRQLITFRTVASTLNFSRAAEVLSYVPSNVTMQMKALEDELGFACLTVWASSSYSQRRVNAF